MSLVILIIGAVLILAGLVSIFTAQKPTVETRAEGFDAAEVLKQLNALLDKFDQRLRLGVLLVTVGAALVGLAGYLEAKDVKGEVDDSAGSTALVRQTG
jgi:hypothetical protein